MCEARGLSPVLQENKKMKKDSVEIQVVSSKIMTSLKKTSVFCYKHFVYVQCRVLSPLLLFLVLGLSQGFCAC